MIYTNYSFFKSRLIATGTDRTLDSSNIPTDAYIEALKKFQRAFGLKDDGIVGPLTLDQIVYNAYRELGPAVPYVKTSIDFQVFIDYLKPLPILQNVKIASAFILANEGAWGADGVGNNFIGAQGDVSRWPKQFDSKIIATTIKCENMTGNPRRFVIFDKQESGFDLLVNRVQSRGLFICGHAHPFANIDVNDVKGFCKAYWDEWVKGDNSTPGTTTVDGLTKLYKQVAIKLAA